LIVPPIGLRQVLRPTREKLLICALALYPLGGVLTDASVVSNRTIQGAVLYALLTVLGLVTAAELFKRLPQPVRAPAAAGAALVLVGIGSLQVAGYLQRYHTQYPRLSAGYWGWQWGPEVIVPYLSGSSEYDDLSSTASSMRQISSSGSTHPRTVPSAESATPIGTILGAGSSLLYVRKT
jgi:hypothetical protein